MEGKEGERVNELCPKVVLIPSFLPLRFLTAPSYGDDGKKPVPLPYRYAQNYGDTKVVSEDSIPT